MLEEAAAKAMKKNGLFVFEQIFSNRLAGIAGY